MSHRCRLAYVAQSLPGDDARQRLALAARLGLALEVPHGLGDDLVLARELGLPIVTLQAWGLHDLSPLAASSSERQRALDYVIEVIESAAAAGIPRVLTVCGFGQCGVPDPFRTATDFFRELAPLARAAGVRVLIELLGAQRASALTEPEEHQRLQRELAAAEIFSTALDTGHLLDAGLDPGAVLRDWAAPLEELQLRAADSRAPTAKLPLQAWLAARPELPAVVAIEHRKPSTPAQVESLVGTLNGILSEGA